MEELSIYNLTVTDDHRLKVNNEELTGDDSILPGDSESLLAWALVQVGYIQQDSDSDMALHIEDQRPEGYGVQKVTIPPGRRVLIEALRKRTGRDLSYITDEVQQSHVASQQAEEQPPQEDETGEDQWAWDAAPEEAPDSPSDAQAPADNDDAGAWEDGIPAPPQHAPDATLDDQPVLAPPPSLDGVPDTPAHVPEAPMRRPRGEARVYEESQPPTSPIQTVEEDRWTQPSDTPQQGHDLFPQGWGEPAAPAQDEHQPQDTVEELAPVSPFAPEPEVTEHETIKTKKLFYKRNRPELGEDEAKKANRKDKPKVPRSKPMIAAIVILTLVVVFLGIAFLRSQGENSYVATCIDERTMVRQASDTGCENDEASYYRWWYTPSGSEVPAVNQTVAQDQGTRIRPEDATIREGFAPEGGPYGGEEDNEG